VVQHKLHALFSLTTSDEGYVCQIGALEVALQVVTEFQILFYHFDARA
jgi:hypothetical protein